MDLRSYRVDSCPPDHRFPGWKVELLDGGKSVSRLWIVDKVMRVIGGEMPIGGISSVGTDEKYRGKGLAGRVMRAALELMAREGYVLSILHGIPDFYDAFGYACCMPDYETRLARAGLEKGLRGNRREAETLRLRAPLRADLPAVARLYNRENADRPGSIVRAPAKWKGFPRSVGWFTKPGARLVVDSKGKLRGYVVFDAAGECRVAEAGGEGAACDAILEFLALRAKRMGKDEISMILPPDHPLAIRSRDFGCRQTINYPRNGEFMGRIIDLAGFKRFVSKSAWPTPGSRSDSTAWLRAALDFQDASSRYPCMYWPDRF
jgi:predicted acetyltransferase